MPKVKQGNLRRVYIQSICSFNKPHSLCSMWLVPVYHTSIIHYLSVWTKPMQEDTPKGLESFALLQQQQYQISWQHWKIVGFVFMNSTLMNLFERNNLLKSVGNVGSLRAGTIDWAWSFLFASNQQQSTSMSSKIPARSLVIPREYNFSHPKSHCSWHVWGKLCGFIHYNVQHNIYCGIDYIKVAIWQLILAHMAQSEWSNSYYLSTGDSTCISIFISQSQVFVKSKCLWSLITLSGVARRLCLVCTEKAKLSNANAKTKMDRGKSGDLQLQPSYNSQRKLLIIHTH
jgi:hypothetical protein